ncbi:MAG: metal ABC transporter ATP-binding protein [Actinobacteria bacterium]|nr:metal ABC transporter ATP-binding protein [Actinomycetota bacterium]
MAIIELDEISFSYSGEPVLHDISFAIEKGAYAGVIGPNGGGKTTLLHVILGLRSPNSGSVKLFGGDIAAFKDWTKIGYLPQRAAHIDGRFPITAYEVVSHGRVAKAGLFRRFSAADHEAIDHALEISDVSHLVNRLISDLSGGERQRVFIARALSSEPEVLILDEPAAGVDVGSQSKFYGFLQELNKKHGITIVFVSHDLDIIAHEASQLICINRSLVCEGPVSLIFHEKRAVLESIYGESVRLMLNEK